jgi:hypothetical protein
MSTRAQIKVTDGRDSLLFYRHSDGYPEGALPTLQAFMERVKNGTIRDNVGQASGWLIMLGSQEDGYSQPLGYNWKVGAIEPATCVHGDIEYFYICDLKACTIKVYEACDIDEQGNVVEPATALHIL